MGEAKKLSYEELQNICGQLQQQNENLRKALIEANYKMGVDRLGFLFKVLENQLVFDDDYVDKVVKEIKTVLSLDEEESVDEDVTEEEE